jgi:hypothetical protein
MMRTELMVLPIYGVGGGGDRALTAERALQRVPGVVTAYVQPGTEMAQVQYDPDLFGVGPLVEAVEDVGFCIGQPVRR